MIEAAARVFFAKPSSMPTALELSFAKSALTAAFEAAVENNEMQKAAGCGDTVWCAHPESYGKDEKGNPDRYHFPVAILKLESDK
jgi:hypothetical protein